MNIIITGGAGFVGSEFAKFMVYRGNNVKIIDNLEYGYRSNFEDNEILAKNFIEADVRDTDFGRHLNGMDIIYHFAGISSLPECESNSQKCFSVNSAAVANILDAVRSSSVKRVVFASTSAVYENNPTNEIHKESDSVNPNLVYAVSKLFAEKICKSYAENYGIDIVIPRFFNVFGPHQDFKRKHPPFTSYVIREALMGIKPIIYNTDNCERDYIYIDDLMQYLLLMGESERHYSADIFNLASGEAFSALEIAQTIFDKMNKPFVYDKGDPMKFWDKYENLFDKNYNLSKERIYKEVFKHCLGDPKKIRTEFGYNPQTSLSQGLDKIIKYQERVAGLK